MDWLNRLVQSKRGASAAEYAMILAIVGAAIAASAFFLGGEVAAAMNDAGSCINTSGGACPS
jgi:pilus assembly protein Flp/PilA